MRPRWMGRSGYITRRPLLTLCWFNIHHPVSGPFWESARGCDRCGKTLWRKGEREEHREMMRAAIADLRRKREGGAS